MRQKRIFIFFSVFWLFQALLAPTGFAAEIDSHTDSRDSTRPPLSQGDSSELWSVLEENDSGPESDLDTPAEDSDPNVLDSPLVADPVA